MKKLGIILIVVCVLLATGCAHTHIWKQADCLNPAICTDCGETQGESLGHDWMEATCFAPKTCSRCGVTEGESLAHTWSEATCSEPKTCTVCNATEGEKLPHNVENWSIQKNATCTEKGVQGGQCTMCGQTLEEEIQLAEHVAGEWQVTTAATASQKGVRSQCCTVCGEVLQTEEYSRSAEEIENEYKSACGSYSYDEIARNPGSYKGNKAVFTGEVIQVQQQSLYGIMCYVLRVDVTKTSYGYTDTIYVTYYADEDDARILEDDIITMYGELEGEKTYKTVLGASVTIPSFSAEYIDIL